MSDQRQTKPREHDSMVSVRLPARLHDALSREALRRDVGISAVIRERLARRVSQITPEQETSAQ